MQARIKRAKEGSARDAGTVLEMAIGFLKKSTTGYVMIAPGYSVLPAEFAEYVAHVLEHGQALSRSHMHHTRDLLVKEVAARMKGASPRSYLKATARELNLAGVTS